MKQRTNHRRRDYQQDMTKSTATTTMTTANDENIENEYQQFYNYPYNTRTEAKKRHLTFNSTKFDSLNEKSSRSLLVNVLDIDDSFGVIHHRTKSLSPNSSSINKPPHSSTPSPIFSIKNKSNDNKQLLAQMNMNRTLKSNGSKKSIANNNPSKQVYHSDLHGLKRSLHSVLKEVRYMTDRIKDSKEDEELQLSWKFAAMVIDRFCMIMFSICTLISTATILLSSKNFFKIT
jgi:hypothetical protein